MTTWLSTPGHPRSSGEWASDSVTLTLCSGDILDSRPRCSAGEQAADALSPSACLSASLGLPLPQKIVSCGFVNTDIVYPRSCVTLLVSGLPAL